MNPSGNSAEETTAPAPDGRAAAGVYRTYRDGFEHGLVILAMGRPFWLVPEAGGFRLEVEPEVIPGAAEQLARFDRESAGWPPPAESAPPSSGPAEWMLPLLWGLAVVAAFRAQLQSPGRWEEAGDLDPAAIFRHGQWWRPLTALFLHADFGHLLSNLLFGIFTFSAVLTTLGRWRGLVLLALASVGGNLAAAAVNYSSPYRSLGASTAIFAGLGLLTGNAIHPRASWRRIAPPLVAGLSLLALYGAGGLNVDVLAHAGGFGAGLILGIVSRIW
jgi:membrane associated rhomboid family serine protease